jgi:hypothetical protein
MATAPAGRAGADQDRPARAWARFRAFSGARNPRRRLHIEAEHVASAQALREAIEGHQR